MNGCQLADAARTRRPDLKVAFITGYAENAVINHGHLDAGMQDRDQAVHSGKRLAVRVRDMLKYSDGSCAAGVIRFAATGATIFLPSP